ncbi:MAG: AAA family ATPase, partial [Thermoleophilaceae bacterium]|nr:AAA family ATPase [Thermoleophilaceae bacterium]
MLLELRVENLLLIERAELRLEPGLNAITGETGAGKTVLAHALDLLLGGKPRAGIVRPGADEAYVEGAFSCQAGLFAGPELEGLRELVPEEAEEIVLGRRVSAAGRSRAFVQGRSATAGDLRVLGGRLVAFYGQHEHRKLTVSSAQLEALDGFAGDKHRATLASFAGAHARAGAARRELEELRARAGERDRDLDLLVFEIEEIEGLGPTLEERTSLREERERVRHLEGLRTAAGGAAEALAPEASEGSGAALLLAQAESLAAGAQGIDAELDALGSRLAALRIEAD